MDIFPIEGILHENSINISHAPISDGVSLFPKFGFLATQIECISCKLFEL